MERHEAEVALISERLKHFYATRSPFRVYHGSTNSTRLSNKTRANIVDTSRLNNVLKIDTDAKIAVVEPNVGMGPLAKESLKHGLIPPVVMEFPGITAGGGFSGTSGESSSFKYGVFESTVEWIEIVLPDGEVRRAERGGEDKDLFWGAASSFGTLGVVTLLGVRLIAAGEYVRLEYHLATDFEAAVEKVREQTEVEGVDFVDGIVFAKDRSIICAGRMVTAPVPPGEQVVRFTRATDTWFYLHAKKISKRLARPGSIGVAADFIPLLDYLFRYNRGAFWTARYAFKYFLTPFNRVTRAVLDPFMHTRVMYAALHQSQLSDFHLLQDVSVPMDVAAGFAGWLDKTFGIYPVWLCPLDVARADEDSQHGIHANFCRADAPRVLNFGVWGPLSWDRAEAIEGNRKLERKVTELGGMKCLYAQTCYEEEEFWAVYDRQSYDGLRAKYHAAHLPSVYDKVKRDEKVDEARRKTGWKGKVWGVWPVRGVYGVYKVVRGGDYLLQEKEKGLGGSGKRTEEIAKAEKTGATRAIEGKEAEKRDIVEKTEGAEATQRKEAEKIAGA
ncbi:related to 24-dehydrocholesterol reductase precursor [Cephalotrichum gorgonifer]|uniref:Delta(24)-sterol reductase n=1 Tax=Cephalotrichum gorgonifer TaxID=2041049 RepID=A0AAE8MTL5_9PEZI|nr:related to 24-dehydrocholesterol reductase precursor [Cephalotrichum gorgonifer]